MPYISSEALVGAAVLVVLALGYQYIPKVDTATTTGSSKNKKKNKKKAKSGVDEDAKVITANGNAAKGAERNDVNVAAPHAPTLNVTRTKPAPPLEPQPPEPTSFAAAAGGSSGPSTQKPKTLAEKIAPKNRKTKVDDMLAPEDRPATHARVMRVTNPSTPGPAPAPIPVPAPVEPVDAVNPLGAERVDKGSDDGSSISDEPRGAREDDGWNFVASKPKKPVSISLSSGSTGSTPLPLPISTKLQKKNAKQAEMKKVARAAEEADRQKRLAAHKKVLERERINEIYAQKKNQTSKSTAGARMDDNGKLIWD